MALVAMATLAATVPAQAASATYPAGGGNFDGGAQGWTGSAAACSPIDGLGSLCNAANLHEPALGNPGGALATRVDVTVNLAALFRGAGTWTSPAFTVPAGAPVTGATFQYDRRFNPGGLLNLGPNSTVVVKLADHTTGTSHTLLSETLTSANAAYAARGVGVSAGALVPGHSYSLRLETTTTTTLAAVGVLGQSHTRFDNARLAVAQAGSGGDGMTPIVSPGVTIVRSPVTTAQILAYFARINETREFGRGPGGSLVPLSWCTIIGTPGNDRVIGTRGNDVICGLGGNDVIDGAGGRDLIDGANGNDRLRGGRSMDVLVGVRGNDRLNGNSGNDRAGTGRGRDHVNGSSGNDRLHGGTGRDRLTGGKGRDRIRGGAGNDRIAARDRTRDRIDGGRGRDRATVDRRARGARAASRASRRADRVRRVERLR